MKRTEHSLLILSLLIGTSIGFIGGIIAQKYHIPRRFVDTFNSSIVNIPEMIAHVGGDKYIVLQTRSFGAALDKENYDDELDSKHLLHERIIDLNKTALILIDVWADHPNDGWLERAKKHTVAKIAPLLQLARNNRMIIIHAPHGQEIAKAVKPLPDEIILDAAHSTTMEFDNFLKENGLETLIYAGYSSNWCVLHRPVGIINMRQRGYNIILLRDCTIGFETPETLNGEWANEVTINIIEYQWGMTATIDDLKRAFLNN